MLGVDSRCNRASRTEPGHLASAAVIKRAASEMILAVHTMREISRSKFSCVVFVTVRYLHINAVRILPVHIIAFVY